MDDQVNPGACRGIAQPRREMQEGVDGKTVCVEYDICTDNQYYMFWLSNWSMAQNNVGKIINKSMDLKKPTELIDSLRSDAFKLYQVNIVWLSTLEESVYWLDSSHYTICGSLCVLAPVPDPISATLSKTA